VQAASTESIRGRCRAHSGHLGRGAGGVLPGGRPPDLSALRPAAPWRRENT